MSDISAVISKRLLRVAKKIEEIAAGKKTASASKKPVAKPASAKPAAKPATKSASTQKKALDNPKGDSPGGALSVEKMNPVVNLIDDKAKALDKMLNAFLAALDRKNESGAKGMLKSIVKKLEELEAVNTKYFKPLTASAAADKKKAIDRTVRRAKALVLRHGKTLSVAKTK